MTTEVENIILNKEYFELSAEELNAVNELVQNAEEYEEMKWFLASTQGALVSEKIEATPELKDKVMSHLNQDKGKRMFWLNSVGVFLWPTEKEVYRRPAFQMSLAALLLIGFLMVYNRDIVPNEGTMALNDDQINETITDIQDESTEGEGDKLNKELESTVEEDGEELADEDNLLEQPLVLEPMDDQGPNIEPAYEEVDEIVSEVEDSEDEEMEMTHDGWYQPEEKETYKLENDIENGDMGNSNNSNSNSGSDEDYERKNTSNANNNELANTRVDAQNKDQDVDVSQNNPGKIVLAETESLSKKDKSKDKDKKGQLDDDTDNRDGFNYDINDVVNSSDISADSTVVVTGNNQTNGGGNNGIDNTSEMQDPHDMGMYNTTTVDGNFGTNSSNEYFPTQMGISSTKELKSLFTTFK